MARKLVLGAAGVAVAAAGWIYASPFLAMRSIANAVQAKDSAAVSAHVDFPALREDVKGKLMLKMSKSMDVGTSAGTAIAGFAQVVAGGVVNQLVETFVSPAGVMFMLEKGRPTVRPAIAKPGAAPAPPSGENKPTYSITYQGWSKVRVSRDGQPGGFIFRRDGLTSWKLVALDMPELQ